MPSLLPRLLAVFEAVGSPLVAAARWVFFVAGLGAAVAVHAVRLRSWRRPVRIAFRASLYEAGVRTLPASMVAAVLLGIGMVFQALYWLGTVGQEGFVGTLLTTVLVREVAPIVVGLLVIGRFGSETLISLGTLKRSRNLDALDSLGLDPLILLVMPRVLAGAVAGLCLSILFVFVALVSGWGTALAISPSDLGLFEFIGTVLRAMGPSNFALLPIKGLLIGLVVSLVACAMVLGGAAGDVAPARIVPQGFSLMLVASLVVSGLVSVVL